MFYFKYFSAYFSFYLIQTITHNMPQKNEYPGTESPLEYFDAIFYIYKRNSKSTTLNFITQNLETNYVMLNMAIITDESGQPDFKKTKQVILSKARRHSFEKVLVICEFPEELSDALIPHLQPVVEHMKKEDWTFWQIEILTENRLNSSFSEVYHNTAGSCFSIAFNTDKLPDDFFS